MQKLTGLVDLIQETINKGATTVEEVHKAILNQPLEVIERVAPAVKATAAVRRVQDLTVGSVYDVIRTINNEVGRIAKDLLTKADPKDVAADSEPAADTAEPASSKSSSC